MLDWSGLLPPEEWHRRANLTGFVWIFFIFPGVQEASLFQYRIQLAEGFKNPRLAVKPHIRRLRQQIGQYQMMRSATAHPDAL